MPTKTEEKKETSLYTKLLAIMADVSYIQKDKRNPHQGYTYASERAIKEALHAALLKHRVLFMLSTSNARVERIETTDRNGVAQLAGVTLLDCKYTFTDVDSGTTVDGTFVGSGASRDEKGVYAAVTGAIKYILTSAFLIPTGDDSENDGEREQPAPAGASRTATKKDPSKEQAKAAVEKVMGSWIPDKAWIDYMEKLLSLVKDPKYRETVSEALYDPKWKTPAHWLDAVEKIKAKLPGVLLPQEPECVAEARKANG